MNTKPATILWILSVLFCGVLAPVLADGLILVDRPHPGPLPFGQHAFAPLTIRSHHVSVEIEGQVATTRVDQVFYNSSGQRLEGSYLFPLPPGARIDSFSMEVDGKTLEAELLDAAKARTIYEDIVRRMKDPALLEYAGQGLFKVRVYPIEAHANKRIRLKYTELLAKESGMVAYRYPLNTEKFSPKALESVSVKVEVKAGAPLATIFSPSHTVELTRDGAKRAVASWEAAGVRPETDFQLYYSTKQADIALDLLSYRDPSFPGDGYFLMLATPSARMKDQEVARKDVVFVLDSSGSMAADDKIAQARRALEFCVTSLNEGDRFEIIRFSTEAEPLFGRLEPVSEQSRQDARTFVQGLKAAGGTAIDEALGAALSVSGSQEQRPLMVVFLTDGRPTIGTTDEESILRRVIKKRGTRLVRMFCFGLGSDVNTHLLDKIARDTRAASQYVLPQEDIEVKVSSFYEKISYPVLANPRIEVSGGPRVSLLHPRDLPDLFRGEQLLLLGRFKGKGEAVVRLRGQVNGRGRVFTYETRFDGSAENDFIGKLWATRRVGYLLDQIRLNGENDELRGEVTRLARRYGIVTPYTAYLIVEDEAASGVPQVSRTLQQIDRDDALRHEAARMYREANEAKSGDAAVGGSMAMKKLQSAVLPSAAADASAMAWRGQTTRSKEGVQAERALSSQAVRYVAGRSFYRNGEQWIDALVAEHAKAERVRLRVASNEYFELLREFPHAHAWFSVGSQLQIVLGGRVYEIVK